MMMYATAFELVPLKFTATKVTTKISNLNRVLIAATRRLQLSPAMPLGTGLALAVAIFAAPAWTFAVLSAASRATA